MCRFVAYLGKRRLLLKRVIVDPALSLIKQSRGAAHSRDIHGDGFGFAWYDFSISKEPGLFRSIQPVWNDSNIEQLSSKIKSRCFLAHVRAATQGAVSIDNCHPFVHGHLSF